MKKVRICPADKLSPLPVTIPLFPSPESIYVWLSDKDLNVEDVEGIDIVCLSQEQYVEAEWRGCMYEYVGDGSLRLDTVRLARINKSENGKLVASIHYGWTMDDLLTFNKRSSDTLVFEPIVDDGTVDLAELFQDEIDSESSKKTVAS